DAPAGRSLVGLVGLAQRCGLGAGGQPDRVDDLAVEVFEVLRGGVQVEGDEPVGVDPAGCVDGLVGRRVGGDRAVPLGAAQILAAGALDVELEGLLGLPLLGAGDAGATAEGDLVAGLEADRAGAATEHAVAADAGLDLVGAAGGLGDHVGGLVGL